MAARLIEVRYPTQPNITELRGKVDALNLGEVTIQEFGEPTDVLVRVQRQGDAVEDQTTAIQQVKAALGADAEIRRTEFIGPTVGEELKEAGAIAVLLALFGIVAYVWFRFEWQLLRLAFWRLRTMLRSPLACSLSRVGI